MPYIEKERVAEIRTILKKEFPKFKLSVTREHLSTVKVVILSAPFDLLKGSERTYEQVNEYYINEHYNEQPEIKEVLLKIHSIANEGNRTITEDGDYGSIPKFYCNISIGEFEKPFKVTE